MTTGRTTWGQQAVPDWITALLGGAGIAAGGLATAWAAWRGNRRSTDQDRRDGAVKLLEDLLAETRKLREELDTARADILRERSDRQAESARQNAQIEAGRIERVTLSQQHITLQQQVLESRTQLSRLRDVFLSVDASGKRLFVDEWQLILLDATGARSLPPSLLPGSDLHDLDPLPDQPKGDPS